MSAGSSDLGQVLLMIGGFLLVIAAIAAIVWWVARRRGSKTAIISTSLAIAGAWLALALIAAPVAFVQTLTAESVYVPDMPVVSTWPTVLPCGEPQDAAGPYLECMSVPSGNATIVGMTTAPRVLLATGQLLGTLVIALPAAALAIICFQVLRGLPFSRLASRTLLICAVVVLVAGLGVDIATGIGRALAAGEVLPAAGDGVATSAPIFELSVQLWPFGAALGFAALAAVFRYGFTLQRDTEGLV